MSVLTDRRIKQKPEIYCWATSSQRIRKPKKKRLRDEFDSLPEVYKKLFQKPAAIPAGRATTFPVIKGDNQGCTLVICEPALEFANSHQTKVITLTEIDGGTTRYRLRTPLKAVAKSDDQNNWCFEVSGFSPQFFGVGESFEASRQSFMDFVHSRFQGLCHLRPFQMNSLQESYWAVLKAHIDVDHFWDTKLITHFETGVILRIEADGRRVVSWLDGKRTESLVSSQYPAEFASFGTGQWFEAVSVRTPKTFVLRELSFTREAPPLEYHNESELKNWIDSLPVAPFDPAVSTWESL